MTGRLQNRKIQDMTREELIEQMKVLKLENTELIKQRKQAQHVGHREMEMLEATRIRSEKHKREQLRLEKGEHMVHISRLIVIILGAILTIYAIIWVYIDYNESKGVSRNKMPWIIILVSEDKLASVLVLLYFSSDISGAMEILHYYYLFCGKTNG
jgi:hypothetical protein